MKLKPTTDQEGEPCHLRYLSPSDDEEPLYVRTRGKEIQFSWSQTPEARRIDVTWSAWVGVECWDEVDWVLVRQPVSQETPSDQGLSNKLVLKYLPRD